MIDTHCHIDRCKAPDEQIVARARAIGVRKLATVGMDGASIAAAIALAEKHDEIVAIVGRHPHEATGFDSAGLAEIEARCSPSARPGDRRDRPGLLPRSRAARGSARPRSRPRPISLAGWSCRS